MNDKEQKKIIKQQERKEKERQVLLRKAERQRKKEELTEANRLKKIEKKKTEGDIVRDYAKTIIAKTITRGTVDAKKFKGIHKETNRTIWMDQDFYCSIVFQCEQQKVDFVNMLVDKFGVKLHTAQCPNIINGLDLAEKMGLKLKKECAGDYPVSNMELRPFILDYED